MSFNYLRYFVLLFVVIATAKAFREQPKKPEFGMKDIFRQLHREPPLPDGIRHGVVPDSITERWIDQPVDHFNLFNRKRWQMRYIERTDYYKPGGPIFIFIGGEWEIHAAWLQTGNFHDIAREVGAYLVYTEHRYYGESRPVPDTSADNLKYLTVDQSLADLKRFIDKKKAEYGRNTKVIVAGGSYAGTMAAWLRYRYPAAVNGAWASCAPVEARADFFRYKEIVGQAYRQEGGDACYNIIEDAFKGLQDLISNNETARIEEEYGFCFPLDTSNKLDVTNFYYGLQNLLSGQVQSAQPGSIASICDYITHPYWEDGVAALAAFVRLAYGDYCYAHLFDRDIQYGLDTDWSASPNTDGYRTWIFQTCNEFGWYQTTGSDNQPYGNTVPASFSIEICKQLYGRKWNLLTVPLNAKVTNVKFQGLKTPVNNVYWTHGELDPWNGAGIVETVNEKSPVDVIPGAAHTNELLSIYSTDTEEMVAVKQRARTLILEWLE